MQLSFDPEGLTKAKRFSSEMTEEEFFQFCGENSPYRIERDPNGTVIMEPPVGTESGFFENKVNAALEKWNQEQNPLVGITVSPSGGYVLANGATRSADASWISLARLRGFSKEDLKAFLPQAPEFVVEIRSPADQLERLFSKMEEWIENGVLLAWLIDPMEQKSYLYRPDRPVEQVLGFENELSGEEVLSGFQFNLSTLRMPAF